MFNSRIGSRSLHRRDAVKAAMSGLLGISSAGWLSSMASALEKSTASRKRHCVLLWMSGGPSQIDTFDLKPNHGNGGEFKEISTSVPGLKISEHLPSLAQHAEHLAILRGVSTKEGDHARGTYLMRTGQRPGSPVRYPTIGSSISKELHNDEISLPNYISINPTPQIIPAAFGPGFLGPRYAAATVGGQAGPGPQGNPPAEGFAQLRVDNLNLPENISAEQAMQRQELWRVLQTGFSAKRSASAIRSQDTVYQKAMSLMTSDEVAAFDLEEEQDSVRAAYGRGRFGQGCLVARRLIERGVPFVEVSLGNGLGWDTHQNNFELVQRLSEELDRGWGMLLTDLKERGLLEDTTILWMGEFGRTPQINNMRGRDHFPNAWTCVLSGGGIQGGQAHGSTTKDGMEVADGKVSEADVLATLCEAVGIDPETENVSPIGRPHKIAEGNSHR